MSPQQTIAHYRITSKLGEGGMGAVYRATDSKLGREVAIKVLPDSFGSDPDRVARFTREAKVLASLNHPNIAAIYGVEENAIVMELVEGETLGGPMSLDEAQPLIQQLIDALEYAHDKGIVHRDLKPANVKITPEGRVKVLDFGLAKALTLADSDASPTITMGGTEAGMIMGTAAYMSPEQAQGQTADRRADIWAFGVVVHQMLTGQQLFKGTTLPEILAAVLTNEPDLNDAPAKVRRLLRLCLMKDPRHRLSHISGARLLLEEPAVAAPQHRSVMPWILTAVCMAVATVLGAIAWRATRPVERPLVRLNVDLGPDALVGVNTTVAISPDGTRIVFPARGSDGKQQLATRLLDQTRATVLPGTENASDPFFSPDGQSVGFFADGKLKKTSVQGGGPVILCDAPTGRGATWDEDGNIIVAPNFISGLSRVSAVGATPQALTRLAKGEVTHRWPQILPGGQVVLFTVSPTSFGLDNASVEAESLKTGERRILHRGGYSGRYLPTGHLVYVHEGVLSGVVLDPVRLEVRGTPVPLLEDVAGNATTGGGQFDFSQTGTLVYLAGKAAAQAWPVMWLERSGKLQPIIATPGAYFNPRFSPDGKRLALAVGSGRGNDLFVYDVQRETMMRLTSDVQVVMPVWTPGWKTHRVRVSVRRRKCFALDPQRWLRTSRAAVRNPNKCRPFFVCARWTADGLSLDNSGNRF